MTAGRLTTHVLDTAQGKPAAGVKIELIHLGSDGTRTTIASVVTNADGRTDGSLVDESGIVIGRYELLFAVGDYFASESVVTADPAFLDVVPVRFQIADPAAHYHVPLLVSPWAYSTYRGS